jgi:riboflavin kinase
MAGIDAVPIDAWEDDDRTYGAASCYGVTLVAGDDRYDEVHAIVPDRTHHDDDQLELIAPERLRDTLDLDDGDTVEIRVAATTRVDAPSEETTEMETETETETETEVA